jgi:hypothetical protein
LSRPRSLLARSSEVVFARYLCLKALRGFEVTLVRFACRAFLSSRVLCIAMASAAALPFASPASHEDASRQGNELVSHAAAVAPSVVADASVITSSDQLSHGSTAVEVVLQHDEQVQKLPPYINTQQYCICRGYDDGRHMVGCSKCEEW